MTDDTRLPFPSYLAHLETESARFREVLEGCDPAARVPGCPDWDAADLLWHLTGVQRFWAGVVTRRPAPPEESGTDEATEAMARPEAYADLLAGFDAASAALQDALKDADPADAAWTWSDEQTVGFTFRRQAHEALIHRLDAEQTAGQVTALDPVLAADGVAEALGVMYGGAPGWGRFDPLPHHVRFDLTDAGTSVWAQLGVFNGTDPESGTSYADEDDLELVDDPGTEPAVVVTGTAGAVDAWLWHRGGADDLRVEGDEAVRATIGGILSNPIT
jgi:uncharacterized protein (TIGR03083 family)